MILNHGIVDVHAHVIMVLKTWPQVDEEWTLDHLTLLPRVLQQPCRLQNGIKINHVATWLVQIMSKTLTKARNISISAHKTSKRNSINFGQLIKTVGTVNLTTNILVFHDKHFCQIWQIWQIFKWISTPYYCCINYLMKCTQSRKHWKYKITHTFKI